MRFLWLLSTSSFVWDSRSALNCLQDFPRVLAQECDSSPTGWLTRFSRTSATAQGSRFNFKLSTPFFFTVTIWRWVSHANSAEQRLVRSRRRRASHSLPLAQGESVGASTCFDKKGGVWRRCWISISRPMGAPVAKVRSAASRNWQRAGHQGALREMPMSPHGCVHRYSFELQGIHLCEKSPPRRVD